MKKRLTNVQVIACGFFLLILAGTLLLCLPIATRAPGSASFGDALFTAVSASCVTGLAVQDTAIYWTSFGQAVILLLIQIGGMGFMTIATFTLLLFRRRIGIRNRERMIESINTADYNSILPLTKKIFIGTAFIELLGAALLCLRFVPRFGAGKGLWMGVFHAVSAFCNAGFDLMGPYSGAFSSMTAYADDPLINLTLIGLIILGGLGYWVWEDLWNNRWHWRRYRLHTKLVLLVSAILTVVGTVLFFAMEHSAMAACGRGEEWLRALFNAVTPRTAGFSTTDAGTLSEGSRLLSIVYMFIGGSSGSTAGGIKTTTIAVLLLYTAAEMKQQHETAIFGRSISARQMRRAAAVATTNLLLAVAGGVILEALHPDLGLSDVLMESFSAIGTVGLSTGITRSIGVAGRGMLILLMYCGRVGSLSFSVALLERHSRPPVTQPTETIIIG